jgi:hypothetical protein
MCIYLMREATHRKTINSTFHVHQNVSKKTLRIHQKFHQIHQMLFMLERNKSGSEKFTIEKDLDFRF